MKEVISPLFQSKPTTCGVLCLLVQVLSYREAGDLRDLRAGTLEVDWKTWV